MDRMLLVAGGLAGALGVALSAIAAHAAGQNLQTAATFLLLHAPALIALSILPGGARFAGMLLVAGLVLFCGDLVARETLSHRLFPYAAPAGGLLLTCGWLAVVLSALLRR